MTHSTSNHVHSIALPVIIAASIIFSVLPREAAAGGWELRTTADEVPGTREIESGDIEKAIRISKVQLSHASSAHKVAVLTNLCIGYILNKSFDQAQQYCDQAVERPNEKTVSHNNRGVLNALQGDFSAAMQDFDSAAKAGCLGECSVDSSNSDELPRPIARRNLARANNEMLATQAQDNDESVAARAD